jgi:hypothetical protein
MNSKFFHLFSFNTYEHDAYIKEFRCECHPLLFKASSQEFVWLLAEFDVSTPEPCGVLEL